MGLNEYLVDSLALFDRDPPDTEYQEGYFDALAYMADYFGVIKIEDATRLEGDMSTRNAAGLIEFSREEISLFSDETLRVTWVSLNPKGTRGFQRILCGDELVRRGLDRPQRNYNRD